MNTSYREQLFNNYNKTHIANIQNNVGKTTETLSMHFSLNYYKHIKHNCKKNISILEIGCSNGAGERALRKLLPNMIYTGIDMSPDDIEQAKYIVDGDVHCISLSEYLNTSKQRYDIILMKAVLEHIPKKEVLNALTLLSDALSPEGIVIIDVPNMDWIWASHERYMDFTHEVGFTSSSLRQLLGNVFSDVSVHPAKSAYTYPKRQQFHNAWTKICRGILGILIRGAEPYMDTELLWARSIIGIGRKA